MTPYIGSAAALAALDGAGNSRLQYLGAGGVARLKGLNIAYLDGLQRPAGAAAAAGGAHGCRFHSQVPHPHCHCPALAERSVSG